MHRIPKSWVEEIDHQGFDAVNETMSQIVQFLEMI